MNDQPKTQNPEPKTLLPATGREYLGLKSIIGPLLVVTGVRGVGFDESVEVTAPDGSRQTGRVLAVGQDEAGVEPVVMNGFIDMALTAIYEGGDLSGLKGRRSGVAGGCSQKKSGEGCL